MVEIILSYPPTNAPANWIPLKLKNDSYILKYTSSAMYNITIMPRITLVIILLVLSFFIKASIEVINPLTKTEEIDIKTIENRSIERKHAK